MTTPRAIRPMLAETASAPFDSDAHWFEVKWDGFRAVLFSVKGGAIRLQSRNLRDLTPRFPEFGGAALSDSLARRIGAREVVLDGELVVLRDGRPSFQALLARSRGHTPGAVAGTGAGAATATYVAFDLLYLDGDSLLDLPYTVRRGRLAELLPPSDRITLCTAVKAHGKALYDAATARGLEGVVAKRADSRYVPGKRSPHWLKVRHTASLDAVIGGVAVRDGRLASLVLGVYPETDGEARRDGRRLIPLGQVGSGLSEAERATLLAALETLRTDRSPFAEATAPLRPSPFSARRPSEAFWVRPVLVCRVEALERTPDGRLRHPVFRGLRSDKEPEACTSAQFVSREDRAGPSTRIADADRGRDDR